MWKTTKSDVVHESWTEWDELSRSFPPHCVFEWKRSKMENLWRNLEWLHRQQGLKFVHFLMEGRNSRIRADEGSYTSIRRSFLLSRSVSGVSLDWTFNRCLCWFNCDLEEVALSNAFKFSAKRDCYQQITFFAPKLGASGLYNRTKTFYLLLSVSLD